MFLRGALRPGQSVAGPALIIEEHQTVVVEPGLAGASHRRNDLLLTRTARRNSVSRVGNSADPVMLEVFNKLFIAIAEQMGYALQNTARSVNIKERLDFSCAIFDANGELVANAPHIPVHLGSMDRSVETVLREGGRIAARRRVRCSTRPITAARICRTSPSSRRYSPTGGAEILFFVAARGHHDDIGGIAPGSMGRRPRASRRKESISTLQAGRGRPLPEDAVLRAAHAGPLPRARPRRRTSPT